MSDIDKKLAQTIMNNERQKLTQAVITDLAEKLFIAYNGSGPNIAPEWDDLTQSAKDKWWAVARRAVKWAAEYNP